MTSRARGLYVIVLLTATHADFGWWVLALVAFWWANRWVLVFE